jgi:hypothetical protein
MLRKTLVVFTVAALGFSGAVLSSEIYKWTDDDGSVHYEDRPIGDDVERIDILSRSTDNSSVQASIDARREREANRADTRSKRNEDAVSAAGEKVAAEQRAVRCQESRTRMESYLQARRLYNESDAGERVYLDDSQILKAREKAQAEIQKHCS